MATESRNERSADVSSQARTAAKFGRLDSSAPVERRVSPASPELEAARATVRDLLQRPRTRCRVSQVQTTRGGIISSADEILGLMLQRPARTLVGLAFSSLIAGPERRIFADRARLVLDGPAGAEWETRIVAPGARIGVPVAVSIERADETILRWYIRDLTDLRRAQARVMELEAIAVAG